MTIGWEGFPNLSNVKSREELQDLYRKIHPDAKKKTVANEAGQIWRFLDNIKVARAILADSLISSTNGFLTSITISDLFETELILFQVTPKLPDRKNHVSTTKSRTRFSLCIFHIQSNADTSSKTCTNEGFLFPTQHLD